MEYAFELGKPVMPVLLDDDVSDADLPANLGKIQRVDYHDPTSSAMAELFSALRGMPEAATPPSNATRPGCPSEYQLDINGRLASPTHLSRQEQDAMLSQLSSYIDGGYGTTELDPLLRQLQGRRLDLTVSACDRLDNMVRELASATPTPPVAPEHLRAPAETANEGDPPVRSLFVSYSRSERDVVEPLVADFRHLGFDVWIDQNVPGGKPWWDQVLRGIRETDAFVFAAGPASLTSRACIAELEYAAQLGKPIARVDVGAAEPRSTEVAALAGVGAVRYKPADKASLAILTTTLTGLSRTDLPPVLPPSPDVPATYTFDVQNQLRSSNELDPRDQEAIIEQIRRYAEEGVSPGDLGRLLSSFKKRSDLTMRSNEEISRLEAELGPVQTREQPAALPTAEAGRPETETTRPSRAGRRPGQPEARCRAGPPGCSRTGSSAARRSGGCQPTDRTRAIRTVRDGGATRVDGAVELRGQCSAWW